MAWTGDATKIDIGPGKLWVATLASTDDPTNASTALDEDSWKPIGYTEEGSTITYEVSSEDIFVAETTDAVLSKRVSTTTTIAFAMAEFTARNLNLALNGGLVAAPTTVEPVDAADEERVKLCLDTDAGARWFFRKCYQVGSVELVNGKAPNKRLIAVEFKAELPAVGKPWTAYPNASGLV
jgi:hypothetical protein